MTGNIDTAALGFWRHQFMSLRVNSRAEPAVHLSADVLFLLETTVLQIWMHGSKSDQ